jgi:hypothetical protein
VNTPLRLCHRGEFGGQAESTRLHKISKRQRRSTSEIAVALDELGD